MSWKDLRAKGIDAVGQQVSPFEHPTGAQFQTELGRVRAVIDAVAVDIARQIHLLSEEFKRAWTNFMLRWGAFFAEHEHTGSLRGGYFFSVSSYEQIFDFEREARTFRESFVAQGGQPRSPLPAPSSQEPTGSSGPFGSGASPIVWAAIAVGAIAAGGYLVKAIRG